MHVSVLKTWVRNTAVLRGVKEKSFAAYPRVVSFLLKKYDTDEIIAEKEANIKRFA